MPFDTDTTSKGSMDRSKVPESCPESQAPAAEASFQSEEILDELFPKYQQCKTGKMSVGAWFHLREVTDREATTKFKSRATKFYKSVSDMAIPRLHAQEYRDNHYTASKNYAKIQNSAIFKSVKSSVKSEMKDDFQAASCFAFRQICGPDLSLPDTAKMREHAAEYMGNSDIVRHFPRMPGNWEASADLTRLNRVLKVSLVRSA